MRSAIIKNGIVTNVILGQIYGSVTCDSSVSIGWIYDGSTFTPPEPATPAAPALSDYEDAIQGIVDTTARERLFRDGVTLASYVASTNEQWAAEATTFIAWRDDVWTYSYAELAKVEAGTRSQPSVEDFLTELPAIVWP